MYKLKKISSGWLKSAETPRWGKFLSSQRNPPPCPHQSNVNIPSAHLAYKAQGSHTCQPSPPRNALHTSDQKTPLSSWGNLWGRACLGPCWGKMTEVCPDINSCNQQQLKVFTRKRAGVKYIKSIIKYIMKQLIQDDRGRVSLSRWLVNCQKLPSTRNFLSLPLIQSLWKATSAKNV